MVNQTSILSVLGVLGTLSAFLAMAACSGPTVEASPAPPPSLRAELERLSQMTIFFGHQSVGANILDGLEALALREGVPLRIVEAQSALGLEPGTWGHSHIAYNGAPDVKVESFGKAFESGGDDPALALMKFCYVDFHASTRVEEVFSRYQAAMEDIKSKHPGTTLVHITVPLTAKQSFFKSVAKRMMRRPSSEAMNELRESFNALLRSEYEGREPLFDLAKIESTAGDGSPTRAKLGSRDIPMLTPAYTDDGEHLNAAGSEKVARALVALLASLEHDRAEERREPFRASQ